MSGEASPAQVAGFLMALRAKGETVDEMRGLADMMLAHASRIDVEGTTLDIVGTGGDRAHTVNISTMAALVAAASGVRVVKHGNRASSSSSGSSGTIWIVLAIFVVAAAGGAVMLVMSRRSATASDDATDS